MSSKIGHTNTQPLGSLYVDKTGFVKYWWEIGKVNRHSLMMAPPAFGKTKLLSLLHEMLSSEKLYRDIKRYLVYFDFKTLVNEISTDAESHCRLEKLDGARLFNSLVEDKGCCIVLLDNIDWLLMDGYINGYHEEAIEFMTSFMESFCRCDKIDRSCMTAVSNLFMKEIRRCLPGSVLYIHIYHPLFGQYLGFNVCDIVNVVNSIRTAGSNHLDFHDLERKFGGYFSNGKSQLFHPSGITQLYKIASTSGNFYEMCDVSAFSGSLAVLAQLFRKMNLTYPDLLKLIHSKEMRELNRNSNLKTHSNSILEEQYSFVDFVSILHDFGLMTYKGDGLTITNADALGTLIKLCDVFITEQMLQTNLHLVPS